MVPAKLLEWAIAQDLQLLDALDVKTPLLGIDAVC
jgi:hypothetical protein